MKSSFLFLLLNTSTLAFPLRSLQTTVEAGSEKPQKCTIATRDCEEVKEEKSTTIEEVDEKGLTDTELITIIVVSVMSILFILTSAVVAY